MAGVIYRNGIPYGAGSSDLIADYYSADKTYSAGDIVIYKGDLYKALVDISTPESWNSAKWQKITIAQNISEIESGIDTLENNINGYSLSDPMTQEQYDALETYAAKTIYLVTEDTEV